MLTISGLNLNTQAPSGQEYFRWRAGEETPPVALSRSVMAAMQSAIVAAFQPRGPETGGVLLGYRDAETGEFVIDGFEPMPRADTGEPAPRWREQVSSKAVGIYRSQNRPGLAVTPADCALVEELFPRHEGVLLLVKPLSATECVGAFFLCDGGVVVDEAASGREFAFTPLPDAKISRPRRTWMKALAPVTAVAAGMAVAFFIHERRETPPDESSAALAGSPAAFSEAPIALKAVVSGALIHLSWDADSASLRDASGGLLTVSDGDRTSQMNLQEADLRRGALNWRPSTRNVTFQMKVNRANAEPLTEFARVAPPDDPINSSSALAAPKPSPLADASAATGENEAAVEAAPAPETGPIKRRTEQPVFSAARRRQPGRVKRVFGGITSKASHLWPFHSARQD